MIQIPALALWAQSPHGQRLFGRSAADGRENRLRLTLKVWVNAEAYIIIQAGCKVNAAVASVVGGAPGELKLSTGDSVESPFESHHWRAVAVADRRVGTRALRRLGAAELELWACVRPWIAGPPVCQLSRRFIGRSSGAAQRNQSTLRARRARTGSGIECLSRWIFRVVAIP